VGDEPVEAQAPGSELPGWGVSAAGDAVHGSGAEDAAEAWEAGPVGDEPVEAQAPGSELPGWGVSAAGDAVHGSGAENAAEAWDESEAEEDEPFEAQAQAQAPGRHAMRDDADAIEDEGDPAEDEGDPAEEEAAEDEAAGGEVGLAEAAAADGAALGDGVRAGLSLRRSNRAAALSLDSLPRDSLGPGGLRPHATGGGPPFVPAQAPRRVVAVEPESPLTDVVPAARTPVDEDEPAG
ncbi:hypothetical protein ACGFI8_01180, partial [Dactylosporangium sp. NPDC048998]